MKAKDRKKQAHDVAYWSETAFLSFAEDLLKMMGDNVSQAELARRVGVSRGYISRVRSGGVAGEQHSTCPEKYWLAHQIERAATQCATTKSPPTLRR
jgi:transcriptional regulator with XRE-family HTH domain